MQLLLHPTGAVFAMGGLLLPLYVNSDLSQFNHKWKSELIHAGGLGPDRAATTKPTPNLISPSCPITTLFHPPHPIQPPPRPLQPPVQASLLQQAASTSPSNTGRLQPSNRCSSSMCFQLLFRCQYSVEHVFCQSEQIVNLPISEIFLGLLFPFSVFHVLI